MEIENGWERLTGIEDGEIEGDLFLCGFFEWGDGRNEEKKYLGDLFGIF